LETRTLTEGLQGMIPEEFEWTLAFYSAKKGRDGTDLDFGKIKMTDIASFADTIRISLLEKTLQEKSVADYSPFLTNDNVGALEISSELIRDSVSDIFTGINGAFPQSVEDYISGVYSGPSGYAFYGEKKDENENVTDKVLFMRRTNPIQRAGKSRVCTTKGDSLVTANMPVIKFTQAVDLLIINDVCYFITTNTNKDFGLESRHYAICAKRMALIAEKGIVSNYEQFESVSMNGKNVRKYLDFDKDVLEYIERLSIVDREEFLSTYGIILDNSGLMDTNDPEQCELIVDLLCCRSCLDVLGRFAVANGVSVRE